MPKIETRRRHTHAGSWYDDDAATLTSQIDGWRSNVPDDPTLHPRAIIAPHAGYSYCGHVMAHAYKHIKPDDVSRVFLLGPSHHAYLRHCALSKAVAYDTPLGAMPIDQDMYAQLRQTGEFDEMDLDVDEAEHSMELHTPYIMHAMGGKPFTLVPILVGALSTEGEAKYGKLLSPFLDDPGNLFVISSDFCHWGKRFSYTFYQPEQGPIWQSITWLDQQAMKAIESGQPGPFAAYMQQYKNTICGRHPIGVLLNMLAHNRTPHTLSFRHYDQSSRCEQQHDSSVSYACAVVTRA